MSTEDTAQSLPATPVAEGAEPPKLLNNNTNNHSKKEMSLIELRQELEHLTKRSIRETKCQSAKQAFYDLTKQSGAEAIELALRCRRVLRGHQNKALAMVWIDSKSLLSSDQSGKLIIWDAMSTNKKEAISHPCHWITALDYRGGLIASGGMDNKCTIYDRDNNNSREVVATHSGFLSECRFYGGKQLMLTASGDCTAALWDIESKKRIQNFKHHLGSVMSLDISPTDKNSFVTVGCDSMACVWDIRCGQIVNEMPGCVGDINAVRFHPSGESFVCGDDDSTLRLFDLRCRGELAKYSDDLVMFACNSVDFSISGRVIYAAYSDYTFVSWDALRQTKCSTVFAHDNRITSVRSSPDGLALATASWDHTVKIWA